MKSTLLLAAVFCATCASSQAYVTYTSISQDNDGDVTTTTLQERTAGSRGSTQALAGEAVGVGIEYETTSFSITLTGAAATPISGSTSVNMQFDVVNDPIAYTGAQAEQFFNITGAPVPVTEPSGVLAPGTYFMSSSAAGSATVSDVVTYGITFVPEPSTSLLGLLGFAALLRRRR